MPITKKLRGALPKRIWVTFQRVGYHHYPNAPEDVSYLRLTHRHIFKFRVEVEVMHNNRDWEFHQLLRWIESRFEQKVMQLDHKSCEMIAEDLIILLQEKACSEDATSMCTRYMSVDVSEDGECGATVEYHPE